MRYRCPVCFFDKLPYPPSDYHICPCCGTEFGNDDSEYSHEQLREMWVAGGANWFFGRPPEHWNPWLQLILAGREYAVPFRIKVRIHQPAGAERWFNFIRGAHEIPRVSYV
jgi:hypothetical protein